MLLYSQFLILGEVVNATQEKGFEDKGISPKNRIMFKRKDSRQLTYLLFPQVGTNKHVRSTVIKKGISIDIHRH